ncbi:MAG TPA: MMPL family transporter [Bacteroidales bacterium]|nr:MMPL family transporter [Bacteroidales bacterium]
MAQLLVRFILRNRLANLLVILAMTGFMGYMATGLKISYDFQQMLPYTDSISIDYHHFKEVFGEDGSVMFIGIKSDNLFELEEFNDWWDLTYSIKAMEGVGEVVSLARIYQLEKDDSLRKLNFDLVFQGKPQSQAKLDSLKNVVLSIPFYEGFLINKETGATLMMVTLNKEEIKNRNRVRLVKDIVDLTDKFGQNHNIKVHYSGLPYIRIKIAEKLQKEQFMFVLSALALTVLILLAFFRSFKIALFTLIIVLINVAWILGLNVVLGYKLTILTAILPPLLIVIVVENCIFMLTKFHHEFKLHRNKVKALSRMIMRLGTTNLLTNAATAAGFATFIITGNKILTEFGILASLSILVAYLLTLMLVPIIFSYLPAPEQRHIKHLETGPVLRIINTIVNIVSKRRTVIYIITVIIVIVGIAGITQLKSAGKIVDDVARRDPIYKDLAFIEENFKGVMPFEISIDTKKKRGVMKYTNIEKLEQVQKVLAEYPEISKSLSVVDVVKFARQAFYNGDTSYYGLPNTQELNFMIRYLPKMEEGKRTIMNSFLDTNMQVTRITSQLGNIYTYDIERIRDEIRPRIDSIFPAPEYDVLITGTSIVYLEGSKYLMKHLLMSLVLAIILISALMAMLFSSARMIIISLIPNLIPLIMTAGMMGFIGITIKPSTIIIFSIALGISVDNAIQYLGRYRLFLIYNKWKIRPSVISALKETGFSMIYSSSVLFFGFAIFIFSTFGGTSALGYLISFTLLMALLCNLFILPSFLLTLDKFITTRRFKEPLIDIFDEELDIELEELVVEQQDKKRSEE